MSFDAVLFLTSLYAEPASKLRPPAVPDVPACQSMPVASAAGIQESVPPQAMPNQAETAAAEPDRPTVVGRIAPRAAGPTGRHPIT